MRLIHDWHFEVKPFENIETTFAAFQITDTQGRRHSSELSRIHPETVREYEAVADRNEMRDGSLTVDCLGAQLFENEDRLTVRLHVEDRIRNLYGCTARKIVANGNLILPGETSSAWQGEDLLITVPLEKTFGIAELYSLEFDLELTLLDYSEYGTEYVRLTFSEPVPLPYGDVKPLAETIAEDGLEWKIYPLWRSQGAKLRVNFSVHNGGSRDMQVDVKNIVLDGYIASGVNAAYQELPAGYTVMISRDIEGQVTAYDGALQALSTFYEPLAALGVEKLQQFRFYYNAYDAAAYDALFRQDRNMHVATLEAEQPYRYRAVSGRADEHLGLVADTTGQMALILEKAATYREPQNGNRYLLLGLWFRNLTDREISLKLRNAEVNGTPGEFSSSDGLGMGLKMWENTLRFDFIRIQIPEGETPQTVTFELCDDDEVLATADIRLDGIPVENR